MLLIGLHGYQGTGKDETAKILAGCGFERVAFADPMRAALLRLNPWVDGDFTTLAKLVDLHGWDYAKRSYPEVRRLLQALGTEGGREMFGENFWVEQGMKQIAGKSKVVITDVRFENEVAAVKAAGGFMFHITRPDHGPQGNHASERDLSHLCDRTISNDGDLEHLRAQVGLAFLGAGYLT